MRMRIDEIHENWQARICIRVSLTVITLLNEDKSCMRFDIIKIRGVSAKVAVKTNLSMYSIQPRNWTIYFYSILFNF